MTTNRPEFKAHDDFIFKHKKVGKVTREEFIKYIRNSLEHMRKLSQVIQQYDQTIEDNLNEWDGEVSQIIQQYEQTINDYLNKWDGKFESFDEDVKDLLNRWIQDGTMDHIINENLMSSKADKSYVDNLNENVTAQLAHTQNQFNDVVSKVTEDSEVILARNGHATLGERLDNMVTKGTFESNADVQLTNLIVNGDFSEGTKSWLQGGYHASFEVIDGVAKTTNFELNNRSFIQDVSDRVVTGNIYYATLRTKVEHVEKNRNFSILSGLVGSGNYMLKDCTNLTDEFDRYSGYGQWGSGGHFRVIYTFEEQGEFPAYLDDVLLIDLTKTFGAGNEPTKEEMDVLIDIIGWFDGKITLTQKQQLIWTLNLIRKNRNAITALGGGIV